MQCLTIDENRTFIVQGRILFLDFININDDPSYQIPIDSKNILFSCYPQHISGYFVRRSTTIKFNQPPISILFGSADEIIEGMISLNIAKISTFHLKSIVKVILIGRMSSKAM